MPSLGMKGPYRLIPNHVDRLIPQVHPGNFAIGYVKESGAFVVRLVGRADSDLNRTLKQVDSDGLTWFKWSYAPSEKVAFDKECRVYHDFGENSRLENDDHPEPPTDTNWKCPICDIFD